MLHRLVRHLFCIVLSILWLGTGSVHSQVLQWIYTSEVNSWGFEIYQAKPGSYLLGLGDAWRTTIEEISVDGEIMSSSILSERGKGALHFFRFDQATLVHTSRSDIVCLTDESGQLIDTLYRYPETFSAFDAVKYDGMLSIVGWFNDGLRSSSSGRIILDLNAGTVLKEEREEKEVNPGVYKCVGLLSDGSTLSVRSNFSEYTVLKRNVDDGVEWMFTEEYPHFKPHDIEVAGDVFYLVGTFKPLGNADQYGVVMKFSVAGEKLWEDRYYAAETEQQDVIHLEKIIAAPDGTLTIAGVEGYMTSDTVSDELINITTDALIININNDGTVNWEKRINTGLKGAMATDLLYDENQDLVIAGTTGLLTGYVGGPERAFVAKLSHPLAVMDFKNLPRLDVSPNPCTDVLNVEPLVMGLRYVLTDSYGSEVLSGIIEGPVDMDYLPGGLFVLSIEGYLPAKVIKINK
jgi:hypothetical protein